MLIRVVIGLSLHKTSPSREEEAIGIRKNICLQENLAGFLLFEIIHFKAKKFNYFL